MIPETVKSLTDLIIPSALPDIVRVVLFPPIVALLTKFKIFPEVKVRFTEDPGLVKDAVPLRIRELIVLVMAGELVVNFTLALVIDKSVVYSPENPAPLSKRRPLLFPIL